MPLQSLLSFERCNTSLSPYLLLAPFIYFSLSQTPMFDPDLQVSWCRGTCSSFSGPHVHVHVHPPHHIRHICPFPTHPQLGEFSNLFSSKWQLLCGRQMFLLHLVFSHCPNSQPYRGPTQFVNHHVLNHGERTLS